LPPGRRVDENAGAFGESSDYCVIPGYWRAW
jgi:hypothetical protein